MDDRIVWRPTQEVIEAANMTAFMRHAGVANYDELLSRAESDPDWFWDTAIGWLDIRFETPYRQICDRSQGPEWATWCVGGTTNVVSNCLGRQDDGDRLAVVGETESGEISQRTYREIDLESGRLAAAFLALGLKSGDAVGLFMPMIPEVAVAFFALARIGLVVVPLFSGFGAGAIASRLNDADAVAVVMAAKASRRGRPVDLKATMDQALQQVPSVRHVVVWDPDDALSPRPGRDQSWQALVAAQASPAATVPVDASHPLLLVYTSGTTGRPKGSILTHCGFAVKAALDFRLSMDLKAEDRLLWMTDFGWVVGPMTLVAATGAGATIVLADGVPDYPETDRLWRLIDDHRISFLGISPTAVRGLMRHGSAVLERHDHDSLRVVASTGEPWTEEAWLWMFRHVCAERVPLLNWSGGTEVGGGIICGTVIHPLKPCSFAGPIPGMAADIVDGAGQSVAPGEVGELVLRAPSIGLTRGLWKDDERYLETYWQTFPGLWRHGDWASRDADGMWYVHGRSDDTIKIAGKRTGPAEIEGLVMATGRVSEAAAIGVPDPLSGEAVVCVCVPGPGVTVDAALAEAVTGAVVDGLGRPFRPKRVMFVDDLPKTRTMKIMRRVVRAIVLGREPGDMSALVNPEALQSLKRAAGEDSGDQDAGPKVG